MVFSSKAKGAAAPKHSGESDAAIMKKKKRQSAVPDSLTYSDYKLVVNNDGSRMYVSPAEAQRIQAQKRVSENCSNSVENVAESEDVPVTMPATPESAENVEEWLKERADEQVLNMPVRVEVKEKRGKRKSRKDSTEQNAAWKKNFFERAFSSSRKKKNKSKSPAKKAGNATLSVTGMEYKMIVAPDGKRMYVTSDEAERIQTDRDSNLGPPQSFAALRSNVNEVLQSGDSCGLGEDEDVKMESKPVDEISRMSASDTLYRSLHSSGAGGTIYETPIQSSDEDTPNIPDQSGQIDESSTSSEDGLQKPKQKSESLSLTLENSALENPVSTGTDEVMLSRIPSTPKKEYVKGWIDDHTTKKEFLDIATSISISPSNSLPSLPGSPPPLPISTPPRTPSPVLLEWSKNRVLRTPPPVPNCPPASFNETGNLSPPSSFGTESQVSSNEVMPTINEISNVRKDVSETKQHDLPAEKRFRHKNKQKKGGFFNRLFQPKGTKKIVTLDEVLHTDTDGDADSESSESEDNEETVKNSYFKRKFGSKRKNAKPKNIQTSNDKNQQLPKNVFQDIFKRRESKLDRKKRALGLSLKSDTEVPKVLTNEEINLADEVPTFEYLETNSNLSQDVKLPPSKVSKKFNWFGIKKSKSVEMPTIKEENRRNRGLWSSDSELSRRRKKKVGDSGMVNELSNEGDAKIRKEKVKSTEIVQSFVNIGKDTSSNSDVDSEEKKVKENPFKRTFSFPILWKKSLKSPEENAHAQFEKESNPGYTDIFWRRSRQKSTKGKKVEDETDQSSVAKTGSTENVESDTNSDSSDYYKLKDQSQQTKNAGEESAKWWMFRSNRTRKQDKIGKDKHDKVDKSDKKNIAKSSAPAQPPPPPPPSMMQLVSVFGSQPILENNDTVVSDLSLSSGTEGKKKQKVSTRKRKKQPVFAIRRAGKRENVIKDNRKLRPIEKEVEPLLCSTGKYLSVDRESIEIPLDTLQVEVQMENEPVKERKVKSVSIAVDSKPKKPKKIKSKGGDLGFMRILGYKDPRVHMEYEVNHVSSEDESKRPEKLQEHGKLPQKIKIKIENELETTSGGELNTSEIDIKDGKDIVSEDGKSSEKEGPASTANKSSKFLAMFGSNEATHRNKLRKKSSKSVMKGKQTNSKASNKKAKNLFGTKRNMKIRDNKARVHKNVSSKTDSGASDNKETSPMKQNKLALFFGSKELVDTKIINKRTRVKSKESSSESSDYDNSKPKSSFEGIVAHKEGDRKRSKHEIECENEKLATGNPSKQKPKLFLFGSKKPVTPPNSPVDGPTEQPLLLLKDPDKKSSFANLFSSKAKLEKHHTNEEKIPEQTSAAHSSKQKVKYNPKAPIKKQSIASLFGSKPKFATKIDENELTNDDEMNSSESAPKLILSTPAEAIDESENKTYSIFERSQSVQTSSSVSSTEYSNVRGSYEIHARNDKLLTSGGENIKSDSGLDIHKSASSCSVSSEGSSSQGELTIATPIGIWGPRKKSASDLTRNSSGEYCYNGDEVERTSTEPVVLRSFRMLDDEGNILPKEKLRPLSYKEHSRRHEDRPLSQTELKTKKNTGFRPLSVHVPLTHGSDTESADHGSTDKSSVSKLTESGIKKHRFGFLDLMKKNKSRTGDAEDNNVTDTPKEVSSTGVDGVGRDGVVYAELDIVRAGDQASRAKNQQDPDKTEYAEIIHPTTPLSKKEELRKSRENLADMTEVTTTPDGKKEAAV